MLLNQPCCIIKLCLIFVKSCINFHSSPPLLLLYFSLSFLNFILSEANSEEVLNLWYSLHLALKAAPQDTHQKELVYKQDLCCIFVQEFIDDF